mmetsp:Transcript_22652/g.55899  ORF Transcript_22652/g.55899 Transcript_22652/m.55899 type:complete len:109 (+) Transcript_22652:1685-2011(+)
MHAGRQRGRQADRHLDAPCVQPPTATRTKNRDKYHHRTLAIATRPSSPATPSLVRSDCRKSKQTDRQGGKEGKRRPASLQNSVSSRQAGRQTDTKQETPTAMPAKRNK